MAEVELPKGIVAIHGRVGDYIYRSRKQPDGTYKTFVHYSLSYTEIGLLIKRIKSVKF